MPDERGRNLLLRSQRELRDWSLNEAAGHLRDVMLAMGDRQAAVNAQMWWRWERGMRRPERRYRRGLCRLFGLPADQLGLLSDEERGLWPTSPSLADTADDRASLAVATELRAPQRISSRSLDSDVSCDSSGDTGKVVEEHVLADSHGKKGVEDVRRDAFLALAGTTLAAIFSPPLLHAWNDSSSSTLPHLDDSLLEHIRAQTEGLRWLDRREGAHKHLPATIRHARNVANLWRTVDTDHPLRSDLAEAAADACHLVAYQAFDQGRRAQAIEWYRCSAELASRAGSQDLYVFAMCGAAYMYAKNGETELALSVLHQLSLLRLSPAANCYTAAYKAHSEASAHRLDLALQALDQAAYWSDRTRDEAPSSWLGIPDSTFVQRQRAMILAHSGAAEAVTLLQSLEQNTPAVFRRYRVTLATDRALAFAHATEVEQSAELLTSALLLNQQMRSVEKAAQSRTIRRMLEPYRDSKAVRAVDEAMRVTQRPGFSI